MGVLTVMIAFKYFGAMALLVVGGEKVLTYICNHNKKFRDWFRNLPMNEEDLE